MHMFIEEKKYQLKDDFQIDMMHINTIFLNIKNYNLKSKNNALYTVSQFKIYEKCKD